MFLSENKHAGSSDSGGEIMLSAIIVNGDFT